MINLPLSFKLVLQEPLDPFSYILHTHGDKICNDNILVGDMHRYVGIQPPSGVNG